jgi:hypothetical protein
VERICWLRRRRERRSDAALVAPFVLEIDRAIESIPVNFFIIF